MFVTVAEDGVGKPFCSVSNNAGVAMFVFIRFTNIPLDLVVEPSKPVLFLQTLLATAFGGLIYISAAYVLRIGELQEVLAFLRARFRRAPVVIEGA